MKRATTFQPPVLRLLRISIHALVKRATITPYSITPYQAISIHALVKRATRVIVFYLRSFLISIHALVKRATLRHYHRNSRRGHFNPRPREEGDGELRQAWKAKNHFNPRPREEGDEYGVIYEYIAEISIHALVKRATQGNDT